MNTSRERKIPTPNPRQKGSAMNATEMKNTARNATVNAMMETLNALEAVQFADNAWAILQEVEGQEIWTSVEVKTKQYKPTSTTEAFDPYEKAAEWQEEKRIKAENAAIKAAEKEVKAKKKSKKEAE